MQQIFVPDIIGTTGQHQTAQFKHQTMQSKIRHTSIAGIYVVYFLLLITGFPYSFAYN